MISLLEYLWNKNRKAASNVLTIILIILGITISAIVYFVVIPLLDDTKVLGVVHYQLSDTNGNNKVDFLQVDFQNNESNTVDFSSLTVSCDSKDFNWVLQDDYSIEPGGNLTVVSIAESSEDELDYADLAKFNFHYRNKVFILRLKINAVFSDYNLNLAEDFEDFSYSNWSITILEEHYPYTSYNNLSDWKITEDIGGYKYLKSTSNNCHYVVNRNNFCNLTDANLSIDFRAADDDATGFIYRYDDTGTFPRFYVVWYTYEHPSPRNGPHVQELDEFDWNETSDQIQPGKITIHYVEGDIVGFNWYKLAEVDWNRNDNIWYTWRMVMNGNTFELFIDNENAPTISLTDDYISSGYYGLISFGNMEAHYDNIFAWNN